MVVHVHRIYLGYANTYKFFTVAFSFQTSKRRERERVREREREQLKKQ